MTLESMSRADGALDPQRLHPSIALAPYVEALVVGRRVAVLGDATLGLADALLARGARLVHAYDPDAARVAEMIARKAPAFGSQAAGRPAARGVVHAVLGDDLGVREGAFDAVLIPDLCSFADRTDAVRRAKKLVAPTGAVVIASPNPEAKRRLTGGGAPSGEALGYYEIYDLLQLQFPVVRMVGQAPFVGYAIVDFAPDREPDVSFDASLMAGTEEPESFVAIASERPIAMDPYLVVEVPASRVLAWQAGAPAESAAERGPSSARDVHRGPNDHVQLAETQARLVLMEAELDDLRAQKGDLARQLDVARLALDAADGRARDSAKETNALAHEAARSAGADAERWRDLTARAGDEHVRAERLGHKVRDLEEELVHQRERAQKLTKQLDDEKRARQKAEIELGMTRGLVRPEGEIDPALRVEELTTALRNAKAHADSLASELLAKSKETAELRREHEAAEEKITDLRREREATEGRIGELAGERDAANAKASDIAKERDALSGRLAELAGERDAAVERLAEAMRALDAANARAGDLSRERDLANARVAETARALHDAQTKLDDLEGEAQTLRRPQAFREPVVVTGEVQSNMVARMTRLEATANTEKRAADEAKREAEEAKREGEAAKREASESKRAADESKRAAGESRRVADEAKRAIDLVGTQRDAAVARALRLEKELVEERAGRKDLVLAKAALESEVIGLRRRIEEIQAGSEAEAAPEVSQLEAALRDRGQKIARLERDMRESERIGRELVSEIEALRAQGGGGDGGNGGGSGGGGALNGQGGAHGGGSRTQQGAQAASARPAAKGSSVDLLTADAFQHRIDALAADAAQKQAELLSSTWRIQALERELGEARGAAGDPSRQQRELSTALVRAQSEIADLRRALSVRGDAGAVPRAAVEDAVLLHQQLAR